MKRFNFVNAFRKSTETPSKTESTNLTVETSFIKNERKGN